MKFLFIILIFITTVFSETIDCTKVFEERKVELLKEVEKIDEARQSFEALQAATNVLFDKQRAKLDSQKEDLNATMQVISAKEENIKNMLKKNQELLDAINGAKNDKISDTYSKMKDSAAAGILEALPINEAAAVIFTLQAKKVSKIMAKMDPVKASKITQRLRIGPPFDNEKDQNKE
ncbi:MotE family protein [Sulfurospirillum arcachonense]|uniref:MotE family protein n=1 Tax=Sulfurospirillum arcachonense TaxID=57666 RepID=UPI0004684F53|nr:MotE family protein [Sulfurospirillum arcachonense]